MKTGANNVVLEDFNLQRDLPLLERWLRNPDIVRWWGSQDATALAGRSKGNHAVITAGGRPVGYLCWQRTEPTELEAAGLTDLPEDMMDIDVLIGEPEVRGQGIGPAALILLAAQLRDEGYGFAGLGTSSSNLSAIRAFRKAGFSIFRDFEDPELGPCKYMVTQLSGPATEDQTRQTHNLS